ncbi:sensor histidine kinase [Aliikangiella sp. IMCC44359]|uniref:sensor histidine kinase n=1 Tax=Aliikangiella sp. IMCC44359 TaxID=3459125 RepID=UPI00403AF8DC
MSTKNYVLSALLMFFITLEILITLNYVSQQKQLREKRTTIYNAIVNLQRQIGYVGLIHNLKNYVLRPEKTKYREYALLNYEKALSQLSLLETQGVKLLGNLKMEKTHSMLNAYKKRLDQLPNLIEQNMLAREIDSIIKYDDNPSYTEITQTSNLLLTALDNQLAVILYRTLAYSLIVLFALAITLAMTIRFFFKEQQKALEHSNKLNNEMRLHKNKLLHSQKVILSVMDDMQREKKLTSDLNIKLSKKNKEMEQFIYTVSHDLKSPLVTIGGFTKILSRELSDKSTQKQQHYLERIISNVNQMELLLDDLLQLSRVVLQAIKKQPIDVEALIHKQCESLEGLINESGASIEIPQPLHSIYANERLLAQCLINLLNNSIKYRDPNRPLVININSKKDGKYIVLAIKDNAQGIDPKYHDIIFRIFERLSTNEGTGVGLAIVKAVMEKHQGVVTLKSQPGVGSCFYLKFPFVSPIEDAA